MHQPPFSLQNCSVCTHPSDPPDIFCGISPLPVDFLTVKLKPEEHHGTKVAKIAQRLVQGLGVQPGELIDVRDSSGNLNVVLETSLAIERVGATPLLQLHPGDYLERLWTEVPRDTLAHWDQYRQEWMK